MAQDSWPSPENNRAITDTEYEKLAARFSDDGVYGSPIDDPVVTAGVGLTVNIRANVDASVRGHGWTSGPTGVVLDIAPNTSGQSRTDRVVLRLDRSTWTVQAVVRQGTPGAGPPALAQQTGDTGVYEVLVAGVTVPNAATAVTVTRGELYVGSRIRPCLASHRNPNPVRGELAYETDTGRLVLWTGSAWKTVYEHSGTVGIDVVVAGWVSTVDSVLEKRNGTVHLRLGSFMRASTPLTGSTDTRLPVLIPAAYRHPTRNQYGIAYTTGAGVGRFTIYSGNTDRPGQVWLTNYPAISTGQYVLPQSGLSWVVD
ncbi:hypothetical protein [Streptomyces nodosus]|uniref:hypothetical protein n=1 Tax=Streptomyces nodosus TaxID=40318 RepID=UPI0037F12C5D